MSDDFGAGDLALLFGHFLMLSLLSIGGAMSTAPDMHRFLVHQQGWLSNTEFTTAVALAQASPGPNVLFVPVLGYQVAGITGAAVALLGILLPSTVLSLAATRWGAQRRDHPGVRAFTTGLAPVTIALIFSASWVLAQPFLLPPEHRPGAIVLIAFTVALMLMTRLAPIWLILLGAGAGTFGWI